MALIFRAYQKNTTTALGILTEATDKRVSVHYNGPGTGSFSINRHSSQAAWCVPDNYVRVYLDSLSNPIFAFFIESGQDAVTSRQEEGGQVFRRGGRGAMAYLERAIIDNSSTFGRFADTTWSWTNATHGQIVKELIDDAKARGALPLLTYDFTNTTESGGGTWATITGTYELPVGLDLLQALARQQSAGLVASMSPSFVLSCSEVIGTDRSGTITFEAGTNISEEVTRDVMASAAKSRMLVQGMTTAGNPFFRWVADSGVETALGDRREGFVSYQATADTATIDRVGAQAIRRLKRRHDGLSVLGVLMDEFVPFSDYQPGDTVTINVPGVWSNLAAPITAISLFDNAAGEADCALEFEDIAFEPLQLRDRTEADPGAGGGSGGGGGGGGGTGGGGGGGATSGPCGGCPPYTGVGYELGEFFDYFGRTSNGNWGTPSTSGHAISNAGGHVRPGAGALFGGATSSSGGAEYTTTSVADFTAGQWRLEMDFSFRPYDTADYDGDLYMDPDAAGVDGFGIGFAVRNSAGAPHPAGCFIYASGFYTINAEAVSVLDSGAGGLAPNTTYTLIWECDQSTGKSRMTIGAFSVEIAAVPPAGSARYLAVSASQGVDPDNSYAIAHVSRIELFGTDLVTLTTPATGQQINNEPVGTGDGSTTTFATAYPYMAGSIVVRINGIDVTDSVIFFDPATGELAFATAPASGSEVTVSYRAA